MNEKWTKLGGLWKRTSSSGKTYLSGEVEIDGKKTFISVWINSKGDNPKRPDYIIYLNERSADQSRKDENDGFPSSENADDSVPF
jgi:hypothetical protein